MKSKSKKTSALAVPNYCGAHIEIKMRGEELCRPIFWLGHQWAVTFAGIECRDGTYWIGRERLWENEGVDEYLHGWVEHMEEKGWVDMEDFKTALAFARLIFGRRAKALDAAHHNPVTFSTFREKKCGDGKLFFERFDEIEPYLD